MKKKSYGKPTMHVVKLQHQCHILLVSNTLKANDNYESESGDSEGFEW